MTFFRSRAPYLHRMEAAFGLELHYGRLENITVDTKVTALANSGYISEFIVL